MVCAMLYLFSLCFLVLPSQASLIGLDKDNNLLINADEGKNVSLWSRHVFLNGIDLITLLNQTTRCLPPNNYSLDDSLPVFPLITPSSSPPPSLASIGLDEMGNILVLPSQSIYFIAFRGLVVNGVNVSDALSDVLALAGNLTFTFDSPYSLGPFSTTLTMLGKDRSGNIFFHSMQSIQISGSLFVNGKEIVDSLESAKKCLNTSESLYSSNISTTPANDWRFSNATQIFSNQYWIGDIACTSTGQTVVVGVFIGPLWISRDYGSSWQILLSGNNYWFAVAVSPSGNTTVALEYDGPGSCVYICELMQCKAYMCGNLWTSAAAISDSLIAVSAVDTVDAGLFLTSTRGQSWTQVYSGSFGTIAMTSMGSGSMEKIIAISGARGYLGTNMGPFYQSSDGGASWSEVSPVGDWQCVRSSFTGQYLIAGQGGNGASGYVFVSSTFGQSWTKANLTASYWASVAISSSGQYQAAVSEEDVPVYASYDYGQTWSEILPRQKPKSVGHFSVAIAVDASGTVRIFLGSLSSKEVWVVLGVLSQPNLTGLTGTSNSSR